MAVKSWPPSRASTTRPPARVISCLVKWPKPLEMGEGRNKKERKTNKQKEKQEKVRKKRK